MPLLLLPGAGCTRRVPSRTPTMPPPTPRTPSKPRRERGDALEARGDAPPTRLVPRAVVAVAGRVAS